MNYRQLEAFRATMRSGSVTAAAKALFISQPSVSRLLRELEHSLGIRLFFHQKGKFSPTREAELLFEEAERSFVGLKAIRKAADQINNFALVDSGLAAPWHCPWSLSPKPSAASLTNTRPSTSP
jgi:DNA-binding transcriptional LysR family regulator